MAKTFNVAADCKADEHYMVDISRRLAEIKDLVDGGKYFTVNRARQYGKTTMLRALCRFLQKDYYVVLLDFQTFGNAKFKNENVFSISFANSFLRMFGRNRLWMERGKNVPAMGGGGINPAGIDEAVAHLKRNAQERREGFELKELFEGLGDICAACDKPVVLMVDEVDSAADNQVFLDFLAQLRACYIDRDLQPAFQSVILAGVYDIKNLKRKFRPGEGQKVNSPWNIASDFNVDMSFSADDIAGMLREYEADYHTGMDLEGMAGMIYDYTSGYPFLVSKLCKLMDESVHLGESASPDGKSGRKSAAWTKAGFHEAVRMILVEKNTLFESLFGKLDSFTELDAILETLLFTGKNVVYNPDDPAIDIAAMFGFIVNRHGAVAVANRIFETRLYNHYLSAAEMQGQDIYKTSLQDKGQFIVDGHLNMRLILEKFAMHFNDLYGDRKEGFVEEEGRKYFLLYLRPIINGTGNYYIESRTRDLRRTDVIVDYRGEQYIIEMKIWRGDEYNSRGEKQLTGYLDDYHQKRGYMVSFNFNRKKEIGVREIVVGDKVLVEAVV